jgi:hypothetical protein
LRRLRARYPRPSQKLPRSRGVLGEGRSRIRTGDVEFGASSGQLQAHPVGVRVSMLGPRPQLDPERAELLF